MSDIHPRQLPPIQSVLAFLPDPFRAAIKQNRVSLILTFSFIGALILAPLILPLTYRNLSEREIAPGDATPAETIGTPLRDTDLSTAGIEPDGSQRTVTIGRSLGFQGFLVSQQGGKDDLYYHFSVDEIDSILNALPKMAWTESYKDEVARHGAVAIFTAYASELETASYFVGPPEIITRTDDVIWRATILRNRTNEGLRRVISVTPIPQSKH
jgi:hypothetical protein